MGINDLIGKVERGKGRILADVLPAAICKKICSDLREVAKAEKAGKPIPSVSAIVRFVKSEYDVKMDRTTVKRWLEHEWDELARGTRCQK